MKRCRIGIDCRLAGLRHAGIGRYITELIRHISDHQQIDWVLFLSDSKQKNELFPDQLPSNISCIITPIRHYSFQEQLKFPKILNSQKLDLFHVPHFNVPIFYAGKIVVTIHDLLWHEHKGSQVTTLPVWQYWIKYCFYRVITLVAVRKAIRIFVPSTAVKTTLKKYYPYTKDKIVITPEAVGEELTQFAKNSTEQKRDQKMLLYVGSLYPHKNIKVVLEALANQLQEYTLRIVGSRSVFRLPIEQQVAELGLTERVIFMGKVSDSSLAELYKTCFATVQPSLSEGFGLTGLEAMSFKSPVIASDIPVFKEVYQKGAVYFDPSSANEFSNAVIFLESAQEYKKIQNQTTKVVQQYSWKELAKTTYQNYLQALSS